ncbi:MAG: hypothetical protein HKN26_04340 [Acidimicrobiales bacterium]|nr:hypothetical protein [Acidimicrobiales bacterium]
MDLGGIIMIVVLLLFPILMLMSMAGLAGALSFFLKTSNDADHADSELLALSEANPWSTDDPDA